MSIPQYVRPLTTNKPREPRLIWGQVKVDILFPLPLHPPPVCTTLNVNA